MFLNILEGFKGIGFGHSLKPKHAGRFKFSRKGFGLGFSLKPKPTGCVKFSLKARPRSFKGRVLQPMDSFLAGLSLSPVVVSIGILEVAL
jgi:hypothetical protein